MLYQVILKSNKIMADDEFHDLMKSVLAYAHQPTNLMIIEARSLDGIRNEVWNHQWTDEQIAARRIAGRPVYDDLSDLL